MIQGRCAAEGVPAVASTRKLWLDKWIEACGKFRTLVTEECFQSGWSKRQTMKKYAIVIEQGENNLSAYVPDLPGCITTGRTVEEIECNMREAIELHLEGLREDGVR
jgi:predicted RNase H-like HicB family nuclease